MRGRRPEPIPGVEPGRWQVWKMRGLPELARPGWMVSREHCGGGVSFPTWREAQDYADRMARTREVVLPRPQLNEVGHVEFDFTEWAGLDYWPEWADGAIYDSRTGPSMPAFGASVIIPREHWKPLANALQSLTEQEKHE